MDGRQKQNVRHSLSGIYGFIISFPSTSTATIMLKVIYRLFSVRNRSIRQIKKRSDFIIIFFFYHFNLEQYSCFASDVL